MSDLKIGAGKATAYKVPTDAPESDGTFAWNFTTLVLVELQADDVNGLGYTYSHATAATVSTNSVSESQ